MIEFKIKAGVFKDFLKFIKSRGTAKETGTGYVTNDCLIEVGENSIEVRAVGDAHGVFEHIVCHDVEIVTQGEIPVGSISQNKDKEPLGLLDCIADFTGSEEITIQFDGTYIHASGKTSQWRVTTVDKSLIVSYKIGKAFPAEFKNKYPVIAGTEVWKNYATITEAILPKIANIAKKIGSMTKNIIITVQLSTEGLYITSGSKISNRSLISDVVHFESEDTVLESVFSHGVGYVFPYIGKCQLFLGKDTNGFTHMWIHEDNKRFTKDYFLAMVPPEE
jgi:hypothetical protein